MALGYTPNQTVLLRLHDGAEYARHRLQLLDRRVAEAADGRGPRAEASLGQGLVLHAQPGLHGLVGLGLPQGRALDLANNEPYNEVVLQRHEAWPPPLVGWIVARKFLARAGAILQETRLRLLDEPAGGVNPRLLGEIVDDPDNPTVLLARDPLGVKPLLFARGSDGAGNTMVAINLNCLEDFDTSALKINDYDGKSV